jgi:hypothetical protein
LQELFSLIVATTAEIGDNSFAHNLGNWPDVPGIFFAYDINARQIVLADRGLGILYTLRRIRPTLGSHEDALKVAFTEFVSGREPEQRGNGLKYVRKVVSENPICLVLQSGDAELKIAKEDATLNIEKASQTIRGCLVIIEF